MTKELDTLLGRYDAGQLSRRELLAALAVLVFPEPPPRTAPQIGDAKLLNHVTLYVRDVERSRAFYQSLFGMPVLTQQPPGVNLSVGTGFLGIYPVPTGESPRIDHFCLGLQRFDAEATKRKLAAQRIDATIRESDGRKELYLADRDELKFQLQDTRYRRRGTAGRSQAMTETAGADWKDSWSELRSRRVAVVIATIVLLFLWIVLGAPGLLVGFLGLLWAYHRLRAWRCPRCFMPIVGAGFTTFTDRCRSCDLEIFSHAIYVQTPPTSLNADAFVLGRRTRRFIAAYEILAGASLMVLSAFARAPWWLLLTVEGLAGMSLAAGVWLWRDELRGYALTRTLQIVQLIRVQSPWLTYVATSGIAVDLSHANGAIQLSPGFTATFSFLLMPGQSFGVAVNLWAAALLLTMTFARPRTQVVTSAVSTLEPAPVANEVGS